MFSVTTVDNTYYLKINQCVGVVLEMFGWFVLGAGSHYVALAGLEIAV